MYEKPCMRGAMYEPIKGLLSAHVDWRPGFVDIFPLQLVPELHPRSGTKVEDSLVRQNSLSIATSICEKGRHAPAIFPWHCSALRDEASHSKRGIECNTRRELLQCLAEHHAADLSVAQPLPVPL